MFRIFRSIFLSPLMTVIAIAVNAHESTHHVNWPGLLMLGNERIFHFVSLAKKTAAFFNISFSILRRFISSFNWWSSACSGLNLPLPRNASPASASYFSDPTTQHRGMQAKTAGRVYSAIPLFKDKTDSVSFEFLWKFSSHNLSPSLRLLS